MTREQLKGCGESKGRRLKDKEKESEKELRDRRMWGGGYRENWYI